MINDNNFKMDADGVRVGEESEKGYKILKPEELEYLITGRLLDWEMHMKLKRYSPQESFTSKKHPKNVTSYVLANQIGVREWVRLTPITYPFVVDPVCLRTLLAERSESLRNGISPLIPFEMDLPGLVKSSFVPNQEDEKAESNGRIEKNWGQMNVNILGNVRLEIAGSFLWSHCLQPGEPPGSTLCLLQFYSFSPASFEFKIVSSFTTRGRILKWDVLEFEDLISKTTYNYFILLNSGKQLLAYDLKKRMKTDDVILDYELKDHDSDSEQNGENVANNSGENENLQPTTQFTSFEKCYETRHLLLLKTDVQENVQSIVIFNFPPNWTKVIILVISHLHMQFFIENEYCFAAWDSSCIRAALWKNVFAKASPIRFPVNSSEDLCLSPCPKTLTVTKLLRLNQFPAIVKIVKLKFQRPQFGMLNLRQPMMYIIRNNDVHFYGLTLSRHSNEKQQSSPMYICHGVGFGMSDFRHKVIEFPDKTSRFLITNPVLNNHTVVTIHKSNNKIHNNIKYIKSFPFADINDDGRGSSNFNKYTFLAMDYSTSLNLIAVLFGSENSFVVNLYEPASLQLVIKMPSVKRGDLIKKGRIHCASLSFHAEFLLVELFVLDDTHGILREVYVGRLFVENLVP